MTIPSDPMKTPHSTPPPSLSPQKTEDEANKAAEANLKAIDPARVWSKFLGPSATPEEVQRFIQGLLRWIGAEIQHQAQRSKEAAEKLKRSIEGDE